MTTNTDTLFAPWALAEDTTQMITQYINATTPQDYILVIQASNCKLAAEIVKLVPYAIQGLPSKYQRANLIVLENVHELDYRTRGKAKEIIDDRSADSGARNILFICSTLPQEEGFLARSKVIVFYRPAPPSAEAEPTTEAVAESAAPAAPAPAPTSAPDSVAADVPTTSSGPCVIA